MPSIYIFPRHANLQIENNISIHHYNYQLFCGLVTQLLRIKSDSTVASRNKFVSCYIYWKSDNLNKIDLTDLYFCYSIDYH